MNIMKFEFSKALINHYNQCFTFSLEEIPQNATHAFAIACNSLSFLTSFNCFCNYFAPLTIFTTMLQPYLQLMTSSSYTLEFFSSMIIPISCNGTKLSHITKVSR
jgi:hypothetical protein